MNWNALKRSSKPVVLYGTGDAAEKIIKELDKRDIAIAGIFASDGFVRSRSFAGFPVMSYSEAKERFGDMIVLLCFGTHLPEVLENIIRINSEQELYAPDLPIAGDIFFSEEYKNEHIDEIEAAYARLADSESRRVFSNVLNYKLTGKINFLMDSHSADSDNWKLLDIGHDESFLDLGAYNGDTVRRFLEACEGSYKRIIAVEPEARNFRKLSKSVEGLCNVELINKAAGEGAGKVYFEASRGRGASVSVSENCIKAAGEVDAARKAAVQKPSAAASKGAGKISAVEVTGVDEILGGAPVSLIKMDIEGQEAAAIRGASESIRKYHPKLLISAYHRGDDLWKLQSMLLELYPEYKFYLRKSPCLPAWEISYYII